MLQGRLENTDDQAKLADLRRVKRLATGALVLCVAAFLAAKWLEPRWPLLAFAAAFFEAAIIGGLADWYAVVALFKRPLGLPIPHTAIIPSNQARIAENLGRFVEGNFLAPAVVERKLREVDFAAEIANWLSDPGRAEGLSHFVGRLIPQATAALDGSAFRGFVTDRILEQIEKAPVAPLAGELLGALTEERRHQLLFDQIIKVLGRFLGDEDAQAALRDKIREQLPTVAKLLRADAYLLKRILNSARSLLEDVRADPEHPMRAEFDGFVVGFIAKLKTSPKFARRAEQLKMEFLQRPGFRSVADDMWQSMRSYIEADAASPNSAIRKHLASLFVDIGRQLAADPKVRQDMNEGFVVALTGFVEAQKGGVSGFIAEQVRSWDLGQMTRLIEINIGRDLQYIRFNGMLIGGFAGLALHVAERFLRLN